MKFFIVRFEKKVNSVYVKFKCRAVIFLNTFLCPTYTIVKIQEKKNTTLFHVYIILCVNVHAVYEYILIRKGHN